MALFKNGFIFGAATAAYQIEGAAYEDGKGLSVWDEMCKKQGKIRNCESADIACDHYHHLEEDLDLLASLKVEAYRFSISWPRLFPCGTGKVNEQGAAFYDRLLDGLLKRGIRPFVTLFHWDYPQALFEKGGWLNPDSPKWFAEYAEYVVKRYGDRVSDFITFNEPQCFVGMGHRTGEHAPSTNYSDAEMFKVAYNVLKAHGYAVRKIREFGKDNMKVAISIVGNARVPYSNTSKDINAAKKAGEFLFLKESSDVFWMDIVYKGRVPYADSFYKPFCELLQEGDLQLFSQKLDYFAVNMYASDIVCEKDGEVSVLPKKQGAPINSLRWNIVPEVLYWGPKFYYERYGLPILITENGYCNYDFPTLDGEVLDYNRINFMQQYLLQLGKAVADGVDVAGYFYWSFMDNFEWAHGFDERFGLVYVDYQTMERTVKSSGKYYRRIIESKGEDLKKNVMPKEWF